MGWDVIRPEFVISIFLVVARISGLFLIAPLFSNKAVPARMKIAFVVMFSLIIVPMISMKPRPILLTSDVALLVAILQEVTLGLVLGFACYLVFAAVQVAGELIGNQVGFSVATLFDPANEGASGILTMFYVILGALLFMALDGHHIILAALTKSFQILPVGIPFELKISAGIVELITRIFIVGMQAAVPLILVLTMLNFIFGFVNKLSPQMNIYFNTGFILGPVVGIIVLIVSIPLFRVLMTQLTEGMEPDLIQLMKALKGI